MCLRKPCLFSQCVNAAESKSPQAVASNPLGCCSGTALVTFLKVNYRNTEGTYTWWSAPPLAGPQQCLWATAGNSSTQASWGLWHLGAPGTSVQPRHSWEETRTTWALALKEIWSREIPSKPWANSPRSQLKSYFPWHNLSLIISPTAFQNELVTGLCHLLSCLLTRIHRHATFSYVIKVPSSLKWIVCGNASRHNMEKLI